MPGLRARLETQGLPGVEGDPMSDVNAPMPWQMTVAKLQAHLADAHPNAVIGVRLPDGGLLAIADIDIGGPRVLLLPPMSPIHVR